MVETTTSTLEPQRYLAATNANVVYCDQNAFGFASNFNLFQSFDTNMIHFVLPHSFVFRPKRQCAKPEHW